MYIIWISLFLGLEYSQMKLLYRLLKTHWVFTVTLLSSFISHSGMYDLLFLSKLANSLQR